MWFEYDRAFGTSGLTYASHRGEMGHCILRTAAKMLETLLDKRADALTSTSRSQAVASALLVDLA